MYDACVNTYSSAHPLRQAGRLFISTQHFAIAVAGNLHTPLKRSVAPTATRCGQVSSGASLSAVKIPRNRYTLGTFDTRLGPEPQFKGWRCENAAILLVETLDLPLRLCLTACRWTNLARSACLSGCGICRQYGAGPARVNFARYHVLSSSRLTYAVACSGSTRGRYFPSA